MNQDNDGIQSRLEKALAECQRLREENDRLRASLGLGENRLISADALNLDFAPLNKRLNVDKRSSKQDKVDLFRRFFGAATMFMLDAGKTS